MRHIDAERSRRTIERTRDVLYILYSDAACVGDEKNRINQRKHDGLAFETAALVFNDPLALFRKDRIW